MKYTIFYYIVLSNFDIIYLSLLIELFLFLIKYFLTFHSLPALSGIKLYEYKYCDTIFYLINLNNKHI